MSDVEVVQGNNKPDLLATLTDSITGAPIDLTTATSVVFQMRKPDDRRFTVNAAATVVDAATGKVRYSWSANDLANPGDYQCQWAITWNDATKQTTDPVNTITVRRT